MTLTIGLMSGTSADGVDGVLARWAAGGGTPEVLAHCHQPFDTTLRGAMLALNQPGPDELHRAALAANALARGYASVVACLLEAGDCAPSVVCAVGAHGQTVRHRPGEFDGTGYTLQLLNGALLAELTGIDVVCDFRNRDLAAGGQGAPLVPAFHRSAFTDPAQAVAVLNVGGIANLTLLPPANSPSAAPVIGFDCGPGNALMDGWCETHTGQRFDAGGAWAAQGEADSHLLSRMLAEPFFDLAPPKSTGRDLFDQAWLARLLHAMPSTPRAVDVQASLCELTALSCAQALRRHGQTVSVLRVCGGGAHNHHLMRRLQAHLPGMAIAPTSTVGIPVDQVEALAFAWLARAFVQGEPGNLASATGASGPRRLGAWYPAT